MTRYHRQELIEGWNQEKLDNSKVLIAGDGLLGNLTLLACSAMGFGDIEYYNPKEDSIFQRKSRTKNIVSFSKNVNPEVNVLGVQLDVSRNMNLLDKYDIVIDATNNPKSKFTLYEFCKNNRTPFISASSTKDVGSLGVVKPRTRYESLDKLVDNMLFLDFAEKSQGIDTSGVMAGLAVEEARKLVSPIGNEKSIEDLIVYSPFDQPHFFRHDIQEKSYDLSNLRVAMVGAGALGNFCGLSLILSGVKRLGIYDFDTIEDTNINRQVFFYGKINEKKADVLRDRLREVKKDPKIYSYDKKIGLDDVNSFKNYDVIIDCVDNFKARALLNYISRHHKIPLISGGTSYQAGQVLTCKDACLDCQFDINKKAEKKKAAESTSCIYAPTPSVITSNMIIGFMQAAQCKNLENDYFPILKYVSNEEFRFGELRTKEKCKCKPRHLLKAIKGLYK